MLEGKNYAEERAPIAPVGAYPIHGCPAWYLLKKRGIQMVRANEIAQRCRTVLESHYGPRFKGLILYGSVARHQDSAESDINLLVLLGKPFDHFRELRRIVDLLYPIQLESEQLISAKPAAVDEFEHGSLQLYRNAKREGLFL